MGRFESWVLILEPDGTSGPFAHYKGGSRKCAGLLIF
jgi:hypothetical protein